MKILAGRPDVILTNSLNPANPPTHTASMGSEKRDVVPCSRHLFASSCGRRNESMWMWGSARPGVTYLPFTSVISVLAPAVWDASVPTYAILRPDMAIWMFLWISRV